MPEGAEDVSGYGLIEQLTAIIKYLMDYPQGLSMLLGIVPPPSCEDIEAMLGTARRASEPTLDPAGNPLRVDGGGAASFEADRRIDGEERWNRIIERAGGWKHIYYVTRDWKKCYPARWAFIMDCVRTERSRVDGVTFEALIKRHGMGRDWAYRAIQEFPQRLAAYILNTPVEGSFQLSPTADRRAV